MPIADLYIRVSTDDQRDKGFSQRSREEVLRKYCDPNFIQIRYVTFEDRNPVHCGKIHIPKYRDEDSIFVQGKHKYYNIEGIGVKTFVNVDKNNWHL